MTKLGEFRSLLLSLALAVVLASSAAQAQTYTVIHEFSGYDGAIPTAGVTVKAGNLWGTTSAGGGGSGGTVYELLPGAPWRLVTIVDFADAPEARVIFGSDGHPYTTMSGSGSGYGLVVNLLPPITICKTANCFWRLNELHSFTDSSSDGAKPGYGDLIWDQQGNIYGTTTVAGSAGVGTVYELMPPVPPSKIWTEKVIWNFNGHDGLHPQNGVIFDGNGNLLGTAKEGGANAFGSIFKLTPSGNTWTETNVYDFQGGSDGQYPIAGLMIDSSGNLYGATSDGGSGGGGTVFELSPSGNTYIFKLLYSFSGQSGKNCGPWGTPSMSAGNLYGTTYCDGPNNLGSIFKLTSTPNGWVYTSLHDFPQFSGDGDLPISNVTFDASGNMYGTASRNTLNAGGVVWEITP